MRGEYFFCHCDGLVGGNYLRVRGEYRITPPSGLRSWELPPRARRILPQSILGVDQLGTTSACAENTDPKMDFKDCNWNYLRVRGEYTSARLE